MSSFSADRASQSTAICDRRRIASSIGWRITSIGL